jgi:hypothetical protein
MEIFIVYHKTFEDTNVFTLILEEAKKQIQIYRNGM